MNVDKYRAAANALVRNPDDPEALVTQYANLAEKIENGRHYLPLAKRAYEIAPEQITPLFNYASALHRTGHFHEALKLYLKGLPLVDEDWRGRFLHHVGIAYRALNENKKACEYYQKAYEVTGDIDILKDAAIATLASGDLLTGFKMFEIRKDCAARQFAAGEKPNTQQKLPDGVVYWNGEDLTGKKVVVYHEEGQGDFIMVSRFLPLLRERGVKSLYLTGVVPDLLDLVARDYSFDGVLPITDSFGADFVIGSMSVPWRCGVEYKNVSGRPYLRSEAANLPKRGKLNVGLIWRGNPDYGMDAHRSMAFSELCPLFDLAGTAFYSLQKGSIDPTLLGFDGFVANMDAFMGTWSDTARVVQAMDVIVTVDTAVAHLAGALGKPVLMMVTNAADWRWNRNSEKTAWYDSMRVIRQKKQDDWTPVIANVKEKLREMLDVRRRQVA